jgi:(1->4)-alpha-D-glucan 1-alpha-D-glucosylmutase
MVRFQQLSAPTAAKSVEDTAFYRYGRLLSRNEVGTEPDQFAITDSAWHAVSRERRRHFPRALLATATHDHKRGEDARMRLAVLSEIPDEWEAALGRWMRLNALLRRDLSGPAPDSADEVMLYQSIIGAWPLDLQPDDRDGLIAFRDRVAGWQEKALREAKRHSGWAVPDEAYESACRDFLTGVLDPDRPARVAADIHAFVDRISPAGALNALGQSMLRLTSPGIPDLYQGCEFWDFSLVDPDNRRPVDFAARQAALQAADAPAALLSSWRDGRVKQAILHRVLKMRARLPEMFTAGSYTPLKVEGPLAGQALAFARGHAGTHAVIVISRLAGGSGLAGVPHLPPSAWQGTSVIMPRNFVGLGMEDALGLPSARPAPARLRLSDALAELPVALLEVR